jgi:hypothetical protein
MPDKHVLYDKIQYLGLWFDFLKPKVELSKSVISIFYYCFLAEQFICKNKIN